jgi:hypothetical protein
MAAAESYKARKEAFVSNLSGGTILEINAVTFVAPVSNPLILELDELSLLVR